MPKQIFLIRHGETEWSLSGQHTGLTDIPLTENGEKGATRFRGLLQDVKFNHVFTSPLQRARRTCELAGLGEGAQIEPDLCEWNYGAYEGRTSPDIHRDNPKWDVLLDGAPEGESVADINLRTDRILAKMKPLEGRIALFSHGHFLRSLAMRWIGLSIAEGRHFVLGTASLSILGFERANEENPVITVWNMSSEAIAPLPAPPAPKHG